MKRPLRRPAFICRGRIPMAEEQALSVSVNGNSIAFFELSLEDLNCQRVLN